MSREYETTTGQVMGLFAYGLTEEIDIEYRDALDAFRDWIDNVRAEAAAEALGHLNTLRGGDLEDEYLAAATNHVRRAEQ